MQYGNELGPPVKYMDARREPLTWTTSAVKSVYLVRVCCYRDILKLARHLQHNPLSGRIGFVGLGPTFSPVSDELSIESVRQYRESREILVYDCHARERLASIRNSMIIHVSSVSCVGDLCAIEGVFYAQPSDDFPAFHHESDRFQIVTKRKQPRSTNLPEVSRSGR